MRIKSIFFTKYTKEQSKIFVLSRKYNQTMCGINGPFFNCETGIGFLHLNHGQFRYWLKWFSITSITQTDIDTFIKTWAHK